MRQNYRAREFREKLKAAYQEGAPLGDYIILENLMNGIPIEIPSLSLRLNPDGSVSHLEKGVE